MLQAVLSAVDAGKAQEGQDLLQGGGGGGVVALPPNSMLGQAGGMMDASVVTRLREIQQEIQKNYL